MTGREAGEGAGERSVPALEPPGPSTGATSRRAFLGLLAGASAGLLAGCAGPLQEASTSTSQSTSTTLPGLGPEPASFQPPSPSLRPPPGTDPLPLRADVCIVGGGAAGIAAAVSAARLGARTILLEEANILGGNVTRGLVNLDKIAYGGGVMVAGFFQELIRKLEKKGQAIYPSPETHYAVPVELDGLRHQALILCRQAGVDVRFGAAATWVEKAEKDERRLSTVWAVEQGHLLRIESDVFVDCTGDGHLGHRAGHAYWLGDRTYGQIQGQTLIFYAAPVDWKRLTEYARSEAGSLVNAYQVIGLRGFMKGFEKKSEVPGSPQRGALINLNMEKSMVSVSVSEVYENHLEGGTLARIQHSLQEQNRQIHAALSADIPGFGESRILRMAERPYLREGRRLVGYHQLTAEEVLGAVKHPDSIARGWYPIDLHVSYAGGPIHWGTVPTGDWYGIPYRCLVARDLDNLLMAGRCISVTHEALGSTRISPLSMALGQAAGTAAALSAAAGLRPADLAAHKVQDELVRQGALI